MIHKLFLLESEVTENEKKNKRSRDFEKLLEVKVAFDTRRQRKSDSPWRPSDK